MHSRIQRSIISLLAIQAALLLLAWPVMAGETGIAPTNIAIASNFTGAARQLAAAFEEQAGYHLTLAFGSTGRHYAQIKHGAPFAAFLAADERRPRLLEEEGLAVAGSRFTYAVGRLVLWSPDPDLVDNQGAVLERAGQPDCPFRHLAVANPKLAPYGLAAREVLDNLGLWAQIQPYLVRGENIGQTAQFVQSGNAQLGFVAASQIIPLGNDKGGSWWAPPAGSYEPIAQQGVLLREDDIARAFLEFLRSPAAWEIISQHGYGVPTRDGGQD